MARVFIDGWDQQKILKSDGGLWDAATGTPSIVAGFESGYALQLNSASTVERLLPSAGSYYFGFHFMNGASGIPQVIRFYNGSTVLGGLKYNGSNGLFDAYKGDFATYLGSTSVTVAAGVWGHVQIYYLPHATAGSFQIKVNDVLALDFSGSTSPSTLNITKSQFYNSVGGQTPRVDNFVVDDANWPGASKIALLAPSGVGNSAQWAPSVGSNYACVDEVPYSDADYVSVNAVDQVDTYAANNMPAESLVVKCVQVQARARKEGVSTPQNLALAVRTGATDYFAADDPLQSSFNTHLKLWENNPNTTNPWTVSEVDGMEIGVKSRT